MSDKVTDSEIKDALQLLLRASQEQEMEFVQFLGTLYDRFTEDQNGNKLKDFASSVNKNAHEKPWFYVAAAALSGFVIGFFCRRTGK